MHTYIRTYVRSTVNEIVKLEVSNSWYLQRAVLEKFAKFTAKQLRWSPFFTS